MSNTKIVENIINFKLTTTVFLRLRIRLLVYYVENSGVL